jgi:hypothetical protein
MQVLKGVILTLAFSNLASTLILRSLHSSRGASSWLSLLPNNAGGELATSAINIELSSMLQSLPEADKYNLLIQSISTTVIGDKSGAEKNTTEFDRIALLYKEMVQRSIRPTARTSQQVINVACTYYDCDIIGKALQLVRSAGSAKAFGEDVSFQF